jgi:hypothetical protein
MLSSEEVPCASAKRFEGTEGSTITNSACSPKLAARKRKSRGAAIAANKQDWPNLGKFVDNENERPVDLCGPPSAFPDGSARPLLSAAPCPVVDDRYCVGFRMPALSRALMQGRGLWAGVRKPPREETAGRKGRCRGEAPTYGDFAMGRAAGRAVEGAVSRGTRAAAAFGTGGLTSGILAVAVRRLADDCLGKPKPEIVGFGSSAGFDRDYCRHHPRQKICLISHGR